MTITTHDLGRLQEGFNGATQKNSPILREHWVTFNGQNSGLYYSSDLGNEAKQGAVVRFRPFDFADHNQVLWKSGGSGNGISAGFHTSVQGVGLFGKSGSNNRRLYLPLCLLRNGEWFVLWITPQQVTLRRESTGEVWSVTGSLSLGNGTSPESIGFARTQSPLSGLNSDSDYFMGDIDFVKIWEPYDGLIIPPSNKTAPLTIRDLGLQRGRLCNATKADSPIDYLTYYYFDGSNDGLYFGSDWGDETTIDIKAKFRVYDKDKSSPQVIWKSGGITNGIAIGIDSDGNLGIFGRSGGTTTSITIPKEYYDEEVWYELYATKSKVVLKNLETGKLIVRTGTATPGNGSSVESIGYAKDQSPITGTNSSCEYFEGDIDYIEIWDEGDLEFPLTGDTIYDLDQDRKIFGPYNCTTYGTGWSGFNLRIVISSNLLKKKASKVRLKLGYALTWSFTDCFIGHKASSGDNYDFDGNQVRVTFDGGNNNTTVTSDQQPSDWIDFALDPTKDLVISFYFTDTATDDIPRTADGAVSGVQCYHYSGSNEADKTDATSGYTSQPAGRLFAVEVIEGGFGENPKGSLVVSPLALQVVNVASQGLSPLILDSFRGDCLDFSKWCFNLASNALPLVDNELQLRNISGSTYSGANLYSINSFRKRGRIVLTCLWKPHSDHASGAEVPRITFFKKSTSPTRDSNYGFVSSNCISILLGSSTDTSSRTQVSIKDDTGTTNQSVSLSSNKWYPLKISLLCNEQKVEVDINDGAYTFSRTLSVSDWDNLGRELQLELTSCDNNKDNIESFRNVQVLQKDTLPVEAIIMPELLAHYSMEHLTSNFLLDETGAYNATPYNSPSLSTDCKVGKHSLKLQASSSQYLLAIDSDELSLDNNLFSISLWFKIISSPARATLIAKGATASSSGWEWAVQIWSGTNLHVYTLSSSGNTIRREDVTINTNQWYHLVVIFTGITKDDEIKIFLDTVKSNVVGYTANNTYSSGSQPLALGRCYGSGAWRYFDGYLDDVRIYDGQLTQEQINYLYRLKK